MEVKWTPNTGSIGQMYSKGIEFSLISKDGDQIHPFVFCKDFLQDVVYGHLHDKSAAIFGFRYDPKTNPAVDMDLTRICIADAKMKNFRSCLASSLEFVNFFAKKMHIRSTFELKIKPHPTYNDCCAYLVGSRVWQNAPPLLSLYTLLLRAGMSHNLGDSVEDSYRQMISGKIKTYNHSDQSFLRRSQSSVDQLMKIGYRKFFYVDPKRNYPVNCPISAMHNNFGICGFSEGLTSAYVPYWHREQKVA